MLSAVRIAFASIAASALSAGCFTIMAYEGFGEVEIQTAWVELSEATPNEVRMLIGTEYEGGRQKESEIEFDPRLTECSAIHLSTKTVDGEELLTQGVHRSLEIFMGSDEWYESQARQMTDECTIALMFQAYADESLHMKADGSSRLADAASKRIGRATIDSPTQITPAFVILLPVTIAADAATAPLAIGFGLLLLTDADSVGSILRSY